MLDMVKNVLRVVRLLSQVALFAYLLFWLCLSLIFLFPSSIINRRNPDFYLNESDCFDKGIENAPRCRIEWEHVQGVYKLSAPVYISQKDCDKAYQTKLCVVTKLNGKLGYRPPLAGFIVSNKLSEAYGTTSYSQGYPSKFISADSFGSLPIYGSLRVAFTTDGNEVKVKKVPFINMKFIENVPLSSLLIAPKVVTQLIPTGVSIRTVPEITQLPIERQIQRYLNTLLSTLVQ